MYQLKQGSIFDQKCDIVIIPCNSHGGVTHSVENDLIGYGLPTTISISNPGEVTFEICPKHFTISAMIGYAASVSSLSQKDYTVAIEYVHSICEQIIGYCRENTLRFVNIPLLGAGFGRLSYEQSFEIIKEHFEKEQYIKANIFALSENVYNFLNEIDPQSETSDDMHPRVFISYTGIDENNKEWVKNLCIMLRQNGVDARCDIYNLQLGYDLPQWMTNEIDMADKVLLICDRYYLSKIDSRRGGVAWETMIIQGAMLMNTNSNKFICIMREDGDKMPMPKYMRTKYALSCCEEEIEENKFRQLLLSIFDCEEMPALAPVPEFIKALL